MTWISVEERTPAVGHTVLFATKNAVLPGYYTDAGNWYLIFQSPSKSDDGIPGVTHWQPLPSVPGGDAAPGEAELGRELIAWAAERANAHACDPYTVPFCLFCGLLDGHTSTCLHLRARALRGESE